VKNQYGLLNRESVGKKLSSVRMYVTDFTSPSLALSPEKIPYLIPQTKFQKSGRNFFGISIRSLNANFSPLTTNMREEFNVTDGIFSLPMPFTLHLCERFTVLDLLAHGDNSCACAIIFLAGHPYLPLSISWPDLLGKKNLSPHILAWPFLSDYLSH